VALVTALGLAACGGTGEKPGSPAVYAEIDRLTDCSALQEKFDIADANHTIDVDRGSNALARIDTSYMKAADARMREIGCYG
jgi:hypothetical protein